jgi:CMP-N-acetylneuraminic acid synthetase/quercetin dioxygenase-like cupin family protein
MKIVAMIPARLESKRVKRKNIRILGNKPLIMYCIDGVKFYKRHSTFSSDSSTNDEFVLDFITNIDCDILVQILPTSPFITPEEIIEFTNILKEGTVDTLISTKDVQIGCVYKCVSVNFEENKPLPPSQELEPVKAYATSLMGWNTEVFAHNMMKYNCGYHGPSGKKDYFTLKGFSTIDIDNEEDFVLAEAVLSSFKKIVKPRYYEQKNERSEVDVPSILKLDGVVENDFSKENLRLSKIREIIDTSPKDISWSRRIVNTENNSATLISQLPGEGNRRHYHDDWNEWWFILDGEWEWEIEGEKIRIVKNDFVFIEKNKWHKITAVGDRPAVRLAVSRADVKHIYQD